MTFFRFFFFPKRAEGVNLEEGCLCIPSTLLPSSGIALLFSSTPQCAFCLLVWERRDKECLGLIRNAWGFWDKYRGKGGSSQLYSSGVPRVRLSQCQPPRQHGLQSYKVRNTGFVILRQPCLTQCGGFITGDSDP